MLTTLSDEGRWPLKDRPDRVREASKRVEAMRAKVVAQSAVIDPHDFVNVLDAPSNAAISRIAISSRARGTMQTLTMAAMEIDQSIKNLGWDVRRSKDSPVPSSRSHQSLRDAD